jgi:hypothetical protein
MMPEELEGIPMAGGMSLAKEALELARAPCGPIGMQSPDDLTCELFGAKAPQRRGWWVNCISGFDPLAACVRHTDSATASGTVTFSGSESL